MKQHKQTILQLLQPHWQQLFLLFVLAVVTYINAAFNVFISDDLDLLTGLRQHTTAFIFNNPPLYLRPTLIYTTYQLFGEVPFFFRMWNFSFHMGSVFMVYFLTYLLTRQKLTALIVGVLFAVHPLLTEAVIWIAGGAYPQYTFFVLATFVTYLHGKSNKRWYWASIVFYILAVEIEKAIVFPFILIAYELLNGNLKKYWKRCLPYFGIASFIVAWYGYHLIGRVQSLQTNFYTGGGNENILLKIPFAITSYLQMIFMPLRLTLYHGEAMSPPEYVVRIIVLLLYLALIAFMYKKNKLICFGLLFFLIALLPVLTPLKVASTVAERYAYLPSFGIFLAVAIYVTQFIKRWKTMTAFYIIFAIVVGSLMLRTMLRNADWRDELSFWTKEAQTSPTVASVRNNLGVTLSKMNNNDAAEEQFQIAAKLNPLDADVYKNIGFIYMERNQLDIAEGYYKKAVELNPYKWSAYNDLAAVYLAKKQYGPAEVYFLKALKLTPSNWFVYFNLGRLYASTGEKQKSIEALTKAQELNPNEKNIPALLEKVKEI